MKNQRETLMLFVLFLLLEMVMSTKVYNHLVELPWSYCSSWRLAVETGNVQGWRIVPLQCLHDVETYMLGGQYASDLNLIVDHINNYIDDIVLLDDGFDAWILDVDDTCLSNIVYYQGKRFGGDPYDPHAFKEWASRGTSRAIPQMLLVFHKLIERGFKVFLITGRDETTFKQPTVANLILQGFFGFERLILRSEAYKGQSGVVYKSEMRRKVVEEGYRIWGNVGDQWSDLHGQYVGNRTFKLPNPMYFVP